MRGPNLRRDDDVEIVDWIQQGTVTGSSEYGNEPTDFIKRWEFSA
jgi:hypothetical protein